jgi:hypothetical protein
MAVLTVTPSDVRAVEIIESDTVPAGAALDAGMFVNFDANGKWQKAYDHASAANLNAPSVLIKSSSTANLPLTGVRKGKLYLGAALDGLAYGAKVYASLTQGALDSAAATNSFVIGTVEPFWGEKTPLKVLRVNL